MTGAGFAQAVIFSLMGKPKSTRADVHQTAVNAGMRISTPGLDKRFNAKAAYFLDCLLAEAVQTLVYAQPQRQSILSRFNGVYVNDSTIVELPDALAPVFQGNNGATDAAAKVAVQWEILQGSIGLWLSDGTVHDQRTAITSQTLPTGSLRLNDLGFFNLTTFAQDAVEGRYFFSRYKVGTLLFQPDGTPLELARFLPHQPSHNLDIAILLGQQRLPCRLIALPVTPERVGKRRKRLREVARKRQHPTSERSLALVSWDVYITNIPPSKLATAEAAILASTRWQIENLFKLWKSDGQLAQSRSQDPHRVWCEFYAKLLACLIQHWILLVGGWQRLDRSLFQATQVIRKRAFCLLDNLWDCTALLRALEHTAAIIAHTCGLSKRATQPLTFQRWLEVPHV